MARVICALLACFLVPLSFAAAPKPDFKAGIGKVEITPTKPIWMSGYAARTKPSSGVLNPLFAKALAIEDRKGYKLVIVTTDVIGLPRVITDEVAARVEKQYGLRRAQLLFNSSHTHTGPVVRPNLTTMYFLDDAQKLRLDEYARELTEHLYTIVGAALADLEPAELRFGQGSTGFAVNRREFRKKAVEMGTAPRGPVDHAVPVIEVRSKAGKLKGILFGYACHNTTHTADDTKISGDYAGFAQAELESRYPGATALFILLCGADQNPNPRGKDEYAVEHGKALAASVTAVLAGDLKPLSAPLKSAYHLSDLAFATHTRDQFEQEAQKGNKFEASRAREMLQLYDQGHPRRSTPYPVQAVRFGNSLTLLALGGEVVVDYSLRVKRHYTKENLIVAGYSNDVMCYIPSLRILKEGGYEGLTSMIYYGQPGPFASDVEDRIWSAIEGVMKRVGARQ